MLGNGLHSGIDTPVLVGLALDSAFHKSSEAGLKARLESLVYLVLAATEVAVDGSLAVEDEPGDPRLGQPGSGIYAIVKGDPDQWASPSALGVNLPPVPTIQAGESGFVTPSTEAGFYAFQYGVSWELPEKYPGVSHFHTIRVNQGIVGANAVENIESADLRVVDIQEHQIGLFVR